MTRPAEIKTTTCYMCACRCGIRVHLRDGEVRYIDGNPEHPLNKGVICAKGASGIMKQVSPARLTQPLLRKLIVNALGSPSAELVARAHAMGIKVAAMAGAPKHALKHKAAGCDFVIAVGTEAGGHTGSTTSMVLWPRVVDAVAPLPVLGAGGVGRGRQMAAALALGCEGVWCGSVWLKTVESEVTPEIKQKLFEADSEDAVLTRTVTGKPCRTLRSAFTDAWDQPGAPPTLPAPLQALLWWGQGRTRVERVRAKDFLTYPVGQIVGDIHAETSVREVVHEMLLELLESKERLDRLLD